MWEEILKLAASNGLWAVMFCVLLFYELKDSRKRESKYVETISALGEKLDVINAVKQDTEEIVELCRDNKAEIMRKPKGIVARQTAGRRQVGE